MIIIFLFDGKLLKNRDVGDKKKKDKLGCFKIWKKLFSNEMKIKFFLPKFSISNENS